MKSTGNLLQFVLLIGLIFPCTANAEVSFGEEVVVKTGETVKEAVSIGDDVYVYGTVKKEDVSIGGDIFVESGGCVKGDAVAIGGDIFVRNK